MRHRFETLYGAGPLNLAVLLLSVAVAGYAASIVAGDPLWPWMAVWFVAVVVVHDGLLASRWPRWPTQCCASACAGSPASPPGRRPSTTSGCRRWGPR